MKLKLPMPDDVRASPDGAELLEQGAKASREGVRRVLQRLGLDRVIRTKLGATAMVEAAGMGHSEVVIELLDFGVNPCARAADGTTALHAAAAKGHADMVGLLLRHGADAYAVTDGQWAIHRAAMSGHVDVVALLIKHGCDPSEPDANGDNTLDVAVSGHCRDVIDLLLDLGVETYMEHNIFSVTARLGSTSMKGRSRMMQWVEGLLAFRAMPYTSVWSQKAARGKFVEELIGARAVIDAASHGETAAVGSLLEGLDDAVVARFNVGACALCEAALHGHRDTVELLVESGVDPRVNVLKGPFKGWPVAVAVAAKGHAAVVELLAQQGAHLLDPRHGSALCNAAIRNHWALIHVLAGQHNDMLGMNAALFSAACAGKDATVQALLKHGKLRSFDSMMGLIAAAEHGHENVVRTLLERGVEPSSSADWTSLLKATVDTGHRDTFDLVWKALIERAQSGQSAAVRAAQSFRQAQAHEVGRTTPAAKADPAIGDTCRQVTGDPIPNPSAAAPRLEQDITRLPDPRQQQPETQSTAMDAFETTRQQQQQLPPPQQQQSHQTLADAPLTTQQRVLSPPPQHTASPRPQQQRSPPPLPPHKQPPNEPQQQQQQQSRPPVSPQQHPPQQQGHRPTHQQQYLMQDQPVQLATVDELQSTQRQQQQTPAVALPPRQEPQQEQQDVNRLLKEIEEDLQRIDQQVRSASQRKRPEQQQHQRQRAQGPQVPPPPLQQHEQLPGSYAVDAGKLPQNLAQLHAFVEAAATGDGTTVWTAVSSTVEHMVGPLALSTTVIDGHTELVQALLDGGCEPRAVVPEGAFKGMPVVMAAAAKGHADVVELLVRRGAALKDGDWCVLQEAAKNGHDAIVSVYCRLNGKPLPPEDRCRALITAMAHRQDHVVEALLQHGFSASRDLPAMIRVAVKDGQQRMVKLLLEHCHDLRIEVPRDCLLDEARHNASLTNTLKLAMQEAEAEEEVNPTEAGTQRLTQAQPLKFSYQPQSQQLQPQPKQEHQTQQRQQQYRADRDRHDLLQQKLVRALINAAAKGEVAAIKARLATINQVTLERYRLGQSALSTVVEEHMVGPLALSTTVIDGHTELVQALLDGGCQPRAVVPEGAFKGMPVVMAAAAKGHADVVELLVRRGAALKDGDWCVLQEAARIGHDAIVSLYCRLNGKPLPPEDRCRALVTAMAYRQDHVVEALLQHGFSASRDLPAMIRVAVEDGQLHMVKLLLEHSNDLRIEVPWNCLLDEARHNASLTNTLKLAMQEAEAEEEGHPTQGTQRDKQARPLTPPQQPQSQQHQPQSKQEHQTQEQQEHRADGLTRARRQKFAEARAFIDAAAKGDVAAVKARLATIDPGTPQESSIGQSALSEAVINGHTEAVEALLNAGFHVCTVVPGGDYKGSPIVIVAAARGHADIVELLVRRGAPLRDGKLSVLQIAASNGHDAVVRLCFRLSERPSDLEAERAAIAAMSGSHVRVFEVLFDHGRAGLVDGPAYLTVAVRHGYEDIVKFLLNRCTDLDRRVDWNGLLEKAKHHPATLDTLKLAIQEREKLQHQEQQLHSQQQQQRKLCQRLDDPASSTTQPSIADVPSSDGAGADNEDGRPALHQLSIDDIVAVIEGDQATAEGVKEADRRAKKKRKDKKKKRVKSTDDPADVQGVEEEQIGEPGQAADGEGGAVDDDEPITLTEDDLADAPKYLECPISFTIMQDPVVCADSYTYERAAIEQWINAAAERGEELRSPMTNAPMDPRFVRNMMAKQAVGEYIENKLEEKKAARRAAKQQCRQQPDNKT